jgi:hypothetical protein
MTPLLPLLACQLVVLAAGYALLRALGIAELRASDVRLIGLAYLAGWASTGLLAVCALTLGLGESLPLLLVLAAGEIAVCLWIGRTATPLGPPGVEQSRHPAAVAVSWISAALIAASALSAIVVASRVEWDSSQDSDAFAFWLPHAEIVYRTHGLDAGLLKLFQHPEYPPLSAATDAMTFFFAGLHPSALETQRTVLGIALLLSLIVLLGRFVPSWICLPFVAALASVSWFWARLDSLLVDASLSYLVAAAAATGFIWLHERRRCWLVLTWLFLAAASLAKLEGFFFSVVLALTIAGAAAVQSRRRALPALTLLAAPFSIALWWGWLAAHGLTASNKTDYHLSDLFDLHYLSKHTYRLEDGLHAIRIAFVKVTGEGLGGWGTGHLGGWALLVPWVVAAVLLARRFPVLVAAAVAWLVLALVGLAVIYFIGRLPIESYLGLTLDRIVPTFVMVGGVLITLLLGLELGARRADDEPAAARAAPARRRQVVAVAAAALAGLAVADSRPALDRSGAIDPGALGRQLVMQFSLELANQGYDYPISAACNGTTPDGLQYLCLVQTTEPVGKDEKDRKVLYWNVTVSCTPGGGDVPRCMTNQGEALD